MSAAAKTRPMIKIKIQVGRSKPHLYEIPQEAAQEIVTLAHNSSSTEEDQWVCVEEIFPNFSHPVKGPATALRGLRYRENLTQVELAKKLGITQADLSNMENGRRPISKKMAAKLAKILKANYKIFL